MVSDNVIMIIFLDFKHEILRSAAEIFVLKRN